MSIKAKSCTRVDFSGGTLDLWPLYTLIPNSQTVNASINCYTTVEFIKGKNIEIQVISPDFDESFSFKSFKDFMNKEDGRLSLLQNASKVLEDKEQLSGRWIIKSESPAGSGLGGSSSLLISMLKVLFEIKGEEFSGAKLIEIARDIETAVLKTPAGIQDYFSPVEKGINVIKYGSTGVEREFLTEPASFWKERVLIVDSEIKHHSGFNNWQILKAFIENDKKVVDAMNEIARVSVEASKALESRDVPLLKKCFTEELEARREVSKAYISPELSDFITTLESIEEVLSFKVCGAGGGGCLMILFDPEQKKSLLSSLNKKGFKVLPFELDV